MPMKPVKGKDLVRDLEELKRSTEAGFRTLWWIAEDYEIVGGVVRPKGKPNSQFYAPMGNRELPGEFQKIREGDEESVLAFVRQYGLLGYAHLTTPAQRKATGGGDPLRWIYAHARGVHLVMEGLSIIQAKDESAAARFLEGLRVDISEDDIMSELPAAFVGVQGKVALRSWGLGDAAEGVALELVAAMVASILKDNIAGIHRTPYVDHKAGGIRSSFSFNALIECIYWQLLDAAEGGELRRCEECLAPFIVTDRRQRFCPPRRGEKESRCALRHRQKRARQKRGEK